MGTETITGEDRRLMHVFGISEERFLAARKEERDRLAARASASMSAPCPACGHLASHACAAKICSCTDPLAAPAQ